MEGNSKMDDMIGITGDNHANSLLARSNGRPQLQHQSSINFCQHGSSGSQSSNNGFSLQPSLAMQYGFAQRNDLMQTSAMPAPHSNACHVEKAQQRERDIARKQQTALRRGLFSASELVDWMSDDCPLLDRQTIIRFPDAVAETLRQRLHNAAADGAELEGPHSLGLVITPRQEFNSRGFDVKLSGYRGRLVGILVELPTLLETYKSLDGDILYKSGDICQMIYVYDPQVENIDINTLCDRQQWEWRTGLTPPTHSIRSRKFKNIDLFDREEIRDAELEVLQLLHALRRDSYDLEMHTELSMLEAREKQQHAKASTTTDRVILATENVRDMIDLIDQDENWISDASDVLFSPQADTATPQDELARAGLQHAAGNSGVAMPSGYAEAEFSALPPLPMASEIQQAEFILGNDMSVDTRERRRLRKEKRKLMKGRKRARREQKLQQQLQYDTQSGETSQLQPFTLINSGTRIKPPSMLPTALNETARPELADDLISSPSSPTG